MDSERERRRQADSHTQPLAGSGADTALGDRSYGDRAAGTEQVTAPDASEQEPAVREGYDATAEAAQVTRDKARKAPETDAAGPAGEPSGP